MTKEQKKDPLQAISDIFNAFTLVSGREHIADLLRCALTTENDEFSEPNQRDNIISFTERLEELLEAAYLLHSKNKKP